MDALIHNQAIQIHDEKIGGLYRVVIVEASSNLCLLVCLDRDANLNPSSTTRPKGNRKKYTIQPLCGQLQWFDLSTLVELSARGMVIAVEIERENFRDSPADQVRFEARKKIMADFLNFDMLRAAILEHQSVGALVAVAVKRHGVGRTMIYKCWSLLCRYGFREQSLRPRLDRCGAPGITRDCSPSGRQKAGRKTNIQRLGTRNGNSVIPNQPGMNAMWRQLIMIADKKIPTPKPRYQRRYDLIIEEGFARHFKESGDTLKAQLTPGTYPNEEQVRRVLNVEIPQLQRLQDKTTKGHFNRSLRGLKHKNWKGVVGPGHTWEIDSTIADIYLRSSINRAWVIGRPIVYVIVDKWSTAVVGFYVCLKGPSWETAKIGLFSAVVDPVFLGQLWNFEVMTTLAPYPSLPAVLMCDRGEYLSAKARETAMELIPCASYAPPYRPDLKGLVEVLHRIEKDHQQWVPGAIDARRAEYELRIFDPSTGVFTVKEYTVYLSSIFRLYNLTADRRDRLDTTMIADNVEPSPAGLWRWGHQVGLGMRRHFSQTELIEKLLPKCQATVTRQGIRFNKLLYESEATFEEHWTASARNFGSWELPTYHFPGTVGSIWTPAPKGAGLTELKLMEQARAARTQTFEEVEDAFAYDQITHTSLEHDRLLTRLKIGRQQKQMVKEAQALTELAILKNSAPSPTLSEARHLEIIGDDPATKPPETPPKNSAPPQNEMYLEAMQSVFNSIRH